MNEPSFSINLPAIVFTDLDGTLLDHHTYAWHPARDSLLNLEQQGIPVIFNTSKTRAELEFWRKETTNRHPFIVENGSAIFIPKNYPHNNLQSSDYDIIQLGYERDHILSWIASACEEYAEDFTGFSQLDTDQLVALTGLPVSQAQLALQREYSEAIHWHGDEKKRQAFIRHAGDCDFQVLVGGRFIHILGHTDKGSASRELLDILCRKRIFNLSESEVTTIACGDSQNDVDMLEWADIAIVIRSPKHEPLAISNSQQFVSRHCGPVGWQEAFQTLHFNN